VIARHDQLLKKKESKGNKEHPTQYWCWTPNNTVTQNVYEQKPDGRLRWWRKVERICVEMMDFSAQLPNRSWRLIQSVALPHPPRYGAGVWLPARRCEWGWGNCQASIGIDNWNSISHTGGYWRWVLDLHVHILVVWIWPIGIQRKRGRLNLMLHWRRLWRTTGIWRPIRWSRADWLDLFFSQQLGAELEVIIQIKWPPSLKSRAESSKGGAVHKSVCIVLLKEAVVICHGSEIDVVKFV